MIIALTLTTVLLAAALIYLFKKFERVLHRVRRQNKMIRSLRAELKDVPQHANKLNDLQAQIIKLQQKAGLR